MHTGKLLEDVVRDRLRPVGLHHGQARVLCAIARNGELSQVEIAHGLHIERATVTNMIQRMEQGGLIERASHPKDKRVMKVRLTRAGRQAEARVRKVWDDAEKAIRRSIPREMLESGGEILLRIRNGLGGEDPHV